MPDTLETTQTRYRGYDLTARPDGTVAVSRAGRELLAEDSFHAAAASVDWIYDHLQTDEGGQWPPETAARICPVFRHITGRAG